jgi:Aminopeptidase N
MKKLLFIAIAGIFHITTYAQDYWQQEVKYNIQVSLNDQQHSLRGHLSLNYINHSPDTLYFIWFHLWPNAYKDSSTALAKQLAADKTSSKNILAQEPGYIDSLQFKINGQAVQTETDSAHIDMVKLLLAQPLLPGDSATITTPFFVQLPPYFSRSGHNGQQYMVCQWYPKPAVYDRHGWHPIPYLDQGEFYSEYGRFTVHITLPSEYVVGATGTLQTPDELKKYQQLGTENNKGGKELKYKADAPGTLKTLQYTGENIHDFAWFASRDFIIRCDTLQLAADTIVQVFSYGQPNGNKQWKNSTSYIKDAVKHYSKWIGQYPYPVVQAVEGPKNLSSGGMEYPMITLITSPGAGELELDAVITHEVGHNWFYGILGSNERDHPWMDEGINTYYQFRYEAEKYRSNSIFGGALPKDLKKLSPNEFQARIYNALNKLPAQQAIKTGSTGFTNKEDYGMVVYIKTAVWLFLLENALGRDVLDRALHTYYKEWQFRHPYPEDFKHVLEKVSEKDLTHLWSLLDKEGSF